MTATTTARFLRDQKILRLATVGARGVPHVVPVWYLYSGKKFYVGTNSRTVKAKNVHRSGRAAFCVDEGINSPIRGVAGHGRARLIQDGGTVRRLATRILQRYFETILDDSAQELLEDTDCIIEIVPEGAFSKWRY